MSTEDEGEWERWKASYARGGRPIPSVIRRARTDRARAILGTILAYLIGLALVVASIGDLRRAHTALAAASSLLTIAFFAVMVVGLHVAMRGTFGQRGGAALDLLADLERRHAGRRRLIRFMPWLTGGMIACGLVLDAASMIATGRFDAAQAFGSVAVCALAAWLVRLVIKRTGTLIDTELRQAAEVQHLLREEP